MHFLKNLHWNLYLLQSTFQNPAKQKCFCFIFPSLNGDSKIIFNERHVLLISNTGKWCFHFNGNQLKSGLFNCGEITLIFFLFSDYIYPIMNSNFKHRIIPRESDLKTWAENQFFFFSIHLYQNKRMSNSEDVRIEPSNCVPGPRGKR